MKYLNWLLCLYGCDIKYYKIIINGYKFWILLMNMLYWLIDEKYIIVNFYLKKNLNYFDGVFLIMKWYFLFYNGWFVYGKNI